MPKPQNSIARQLISLSWPIVLAFIMQTSYHVIDIFWVGKLGALEIAAVSLAGIVFYVILAVGQILGSGTVALVSQSFGARMVERANDVVKQAMILTSIVAFIVALMGFLHSHDIVYLLGGRDQILTLGTQYLRIVCIGFFFQILSFTINYAFRGAGDMKTPMVIMLIAALCNIILDPVLIFGVGFIPALGIRGAASATAIAKGLSFMFGFIILLKGKSKLKLRLRRLWHLEANIVKTMLTVGVPAGLSYALMFLSVGAIFSTVASFSGNALAALGIGHRVLQFASLPVVGIGVATTTLIGQSLGAQRPGNAFRISTVSISISACVMFLFSTLFFIFARPIIAIFTNDLSVVSYGIDFLHVVSFYLIFAGSTITLTGVFRGAGDMIPPMVTGLIKLALLVVFARYFTRDPGLNVIGVWYAMLLSYGIECILLFAWFSTGRWRKRGLRLLDTIKTTTHGVKSLL